MKYHKHEIKIVVEDLGYEESNLNKTYEVWKDGKRLASTWTLNNAKEYIDSNYDENVLC